MCVCVCEISVIRRFRRSLGLIRGYLVRLDTLHSFLFCAVILCRILSAFCDPLILCASGNKLLSLIIQLRYVTHCLSVQRVELRQGTYNPILLTLIVTLIDICDSLFSYQMVQF